MKVAVRHAASLLQDHQAGADHSAAHHCPALQPTPDCWEQTGVHNVKYADDKPRPHIKRRCKKGAMRSHLLAEVVFPSSLKRADGDPLTVNG